MISSPFAVVAFRDPTQNGSFHIKNKMRERKKNLNIKREHCIFFFKSQTFVEFEFELSECLTSPWRDLLLMLKREFYWQFHWLIPAPAINSQILSILITAFNLRLQGLFLPVQSEKLDFTEVTWPLTPHSYCSFRSCHLAENRFFLVILGLKSTPSFWEENKEKAAFFFFSLTCRDEGPGRGS